MQIIKSTTAYFVDMSFRRQHRIKLWLDQDLTGCMSNELSQRPIDQNKKLALSEFIFYRQHSLKITEKTVSNGQVKRIQPYH